MKKLVIYFAVLESKNYKSSSTALVEDPSIKHFHEWMQKRAIKCKEEWGEDAIISNCKIIKL